MAQRHHLTTRTRAQRDPARRQQARRRGQGHPRPQGPQRRHREEVRLAHRSPRTASPSPRRSSSRIRSRTWARRWCRRSPPRPPTSPATAPPPRPCSPRRSIREGLKNVTAGANPMELKRGIDKAVEAVVERARRSSVQAGQGQGDRPGRHHLRQQRRRDRQDHRRGDGEGRQGRRDHGRGGQAASRPRSRSSRACSSTAATSRPTS